MRSAALVLLLLTGCAAPSAAPAPRGAPPAPPPPPASASALPVASAPAPAPAPLAFIEDDIPGATKQAKAAHKALFIDAWAVWCHTCSSMKHTVLDNPALAPLSKRVVFASVDTDRPGNAAFLDKYAVTVWPTFFMVDPDSGTLLGYWPGAASLRELSGFVKGSLDALDRLEAKKLAPDSPLARLLAAKDAQASHDYAVAAKRYAALIAAAPADWSRRSEALLGWMQSLFQSDGATKCARTGVKHLSEVSGAAMPADYCFYTLACIAHVHGAEQEKLRQAVVQRLRELTSHPPQGASADDRADALGILADALVASGDRKGAGETSQKRLAILETAAAAAPTPEAASTYDDGRAAAYVALGRADEAIAMLEKREKQLPDSFEPPARLASVLSDLKRWKPALAAIDRALGHAYGPRALRYLALKARIQLALGDHKGRLATLETEVKGYKALARGQSNAARLHDAERRLHEARAGR
jgi:tetratricopeptide (TPR) repeat protein